jgi:hypothetical protein
MRIHAIHDLNRRSLVRFLTDALFAVFCGAAGGSLLALMTDYATTL